MNFVFLLPSVHPAISSFILFSQRFAVRFLLFDKSYLYYWLSRQSSHSSVRLPSSSSSIPIHSRAGIPSLLPTLSPFHVYVLSSIRSSVCMFVHLSFWPSVWPFVCSSVRPWLVRPSVRLSSARPSVRQSIRPYSTSCNLR